MPARHGWALVEMHLATVLFGLTGLFAKFVEASPTLITAGRTMFAASTILVVGKILRLDLCLRSRGDLGQLALSAALLVLHWLAFFHSIQISTVAIGMLGFASFPLFVTLLEPIWFEERLGWIDLVAVALVTGGLALLAPEFSFENRTTLGLAWAVLSGFLYALFALLTRAGVRRYSQVTVSFFQQTICCALTVPLAIGEIDRLTTKNIALLALLGIICTALAHLLFLGSLKSLRAQTASIIICLEPVYGILFAWPLLHEIPDARTLLGGGLILATAAGSTLHWARRARAIEVQG
ncbi:MAG: DMT family transporter [Pirellulales bacterium]|nr:DMT family transporter [Pirellulales bacterium]